MFFKITSSNLETNKKKSTSLLPPSNVMIASIRSIPKTLEHYPKHSRSYSGHVQFSSGFRGLDIADAGNGERAGDKGRDGEGNFSRVAGNFTLLLGQVSKARFALVENVVLLATLAASSRWLSPRFASSSRLR